jgi:hypothetical protein
MIIVRWIVLLLLLAGVMCFAMYVGTGQMRWRIIGLRILRVTVVVALGFFGVLILERLVPLL